MGFTTDGVEFLASAKADGVSFERTVTLGRQKFYWVTPRAACRALRKHGLDVSSSDVEHWLARERGFTEPFLEHLGAAEVRSIDASTFEGATDLHDLNKRIPPDLRERFSAVIDSGTLEHVFNFPVGIANAMEMVELGGHLLLLTPSNNEGGHGFYQFAPELFFRVLQPNNGFTIDRVFLKEYRGSNWYRVTDPAEIRRRCQFRSNGPAYLYVQAQRRRIVPIFETWPQQSDYESSWIQAAGESGAADNTTTRVGPLAGARSLKSRVRQLAPPAVLKGYHSLHRKVLEHREQQPLSYRHQRRMFRRVTTGK